MHIHYSGYVISRSEPSSDKVFPYMLSTECNFCFEMLDPYWTGKVQPQRYRKVPFHMYLMGNYTYYTEITLPNSPSSLYRPPYTPVVFRQYSKPYSFYGSILSSGD